MKEIKSAIVRFTIAAVLIASPLYYENGYFNTLVAKAHIVWAICGVSLAAFILVTIAQAIREPQSLALEWKNLRRSLTPPDLCVAVFGLTALISSLLSDYMYAAFTGSRGWNMGGITLMLLCAMYFMVSRYAKRDPLLWVYVAISASAEYVLAFLNGLSIDPLGLHANLVTDELFEYIATVGNINSYSGYLALTLPLLTMVFIADERRWLHAWTGVLLAVGFTNPFMNNSDGAWLGVCFSMLFLIYYCLKDRRKYDHLLQAGLLFCAGGLLVRFGITFMTDSHVEFSGISAAILEYHLDLLIGAVCLALLLLKRVLEKHTNEKTDRRLAITFGIIAGIAVGVVVVYNVSIFDGSWGTKRGYIWQMAMELFADGSIKDQLVGVGPDCFGIPIMDRFSDFVSEHWGKRVANAHNEYIQYLITMGIAGAVSYLGLYVSSWRRFVKRISWNETKAALFMAVMGYAGQAFVNNPQAMNMAILFVCLGLLRSERSDGSRLPEKSAAPAESRRQKSSRKKEKGKKSK